MRLKNLDGKNVISFTAENKQLSTESGLTVYFEHSFAYIAHQTLERMLALFIYYLPQTVCIHTQLVYRFYFLSEVLNFFCFIIEFRHNKLVFAGSIARRSTLFISTRFQFD